MTSWLPIPYKVIVLGGGLSGLSAAHAVIKHSKIPCHVTILESQSRVGGWLESTRFDDGTVYEHGPRTARSYGNTALEALNIVSELNLDDKIIGIPKHFDAAKRRYIYAKGKINELPSSLSSIVMRQEPFEKSLLSSLVREPFVKKSELPDESVHSFFTRRFNKEIADYLSDPLCRGIFGGDSKRLSIRSCFKILFDYERQHGSVIKGALFSKSAKTSFTDNSLIQRAKAENWMAWTLTNGIQTLPEIWAEYLKQRGVSISLNTHCNEVRFTSDNKVLCETQNEILQADAIITTLPSTSLSPLLRNTDTKLSTLLDSVEYATMAVINLEYKDKQLKYNGFGFLVPSCEPCDILGATFDSLVLPSHVRRDATIVTIMAGGAWFQELFGNPDAADKNKITELAVKSSRDILGITETPVRSMCKIQKHCIPQYYVGHESKVDDIKNRAKSNNFPMVNVGNAWGGVGINDVILNARNETLKWLAANTMY